jgi:hypothetical protein
LVSDLFITSAVRMESMIPTSGSSRIPSQMGVTGVDISCSDLQLLAHPGGLFRLLHGALELAMLLYLGCDVGGKLDDLAGFAGEIQHRVVGALDPDLFPCLPIRQNSPARYSPRRRVSQKLR